MYKTRQRELRVALAGTTTPLIAIPGMQSDDFSAGEASTEQTDSYEGSTTETGNVPAGSFSCECLNSPMDYVLQDLEQAYRDQSARTFLLFTKGEGTIFTGPSGGTAAVAADGVVTFAGSGTPPDLTGTTFKRGHMLVIGSKNLMVRKITEAGVMTVGLAPGATGNLQTSAGSYTIEHPDVVVGTFRATIPGFGGVSNAAGGVQTMSFTIQPQGLLPSARPATAAESMSAL